MIKTNEHPLRRTLSAEIRARPYEHIQAPAMVSHIVIMSGERGSKDDHAHVTALCKMLKIEPPTDDASHFSVNLDGWRLKWERHTEFATYSFFKDATLDIPFSEFAIDSVPDDWLKALPGKLLAATHITIESKETPQRPFDELASLFKDGDITGSNMLGDRAKVWTDFRIHEDGFGRILIRDEGLNPRAAGRLVQRLLEVESYRMMAMLALPLAHAARPKVAEIERHLGEIVPKLAATEGIEEERALLRQLSAMAAEIEAVSTSTNYRFSAANAYFALVTRRVEELRETRMEGLQPPGEFLRRRLIPARETCASIASRQEDVSQRIAHANDLLRTRINIALEEQNRDLLKSMNRRAETQVRLQETVKGLSVIAITYYLLNIIHYIAESAKAAALNIDPDITVGLAFPVVVFIVWLGTRWFKHTFRKIADKDNDQKQG